MKRWLTKLTPEQESRLPAIRDEWRGIGLATGPSDRAAAEAAVADAYREAGLTAPKLCLWLSSPLHGGVCAAMLKHGRAVWGQVRGQVWDQVWDQVWGQVRGQVRGQVWDQVRGQVWDQVRDQVGDQVWGQVWGQVWDQVRGQVRGQYSTAIWGQHEAGWHSFYAAFREFGIKECARLLPLERVAREAGWWFPYSEIAVLTERPTALHRDDRNRLHCETGPAVDYAGTWGVWAWHGVRVDRSVIEDPQTAQLVLAEQNSEILRIRIDRYGFERLLRETKAAVLDSDIDGAGQPRRLLSLALPGDPDGRLVAVHVQCPSTGHEHFLRVPPTIKRCSQGVAWTFGVDTTEYAPVVEA